MSKINPGMTRAEIRASKKGKASKKGRQTAKLRGLAQAIHETAARAEGPGEQFVAPKPLRAMTESQATYMGSIAKNVLTFGVGQAGTGKSFVVGAMAADALLAKSTAKIIVTRPVVEAGESLGFLPGEQDEKFAPYFGPFREILVRRLGPSMLEYLVKRGAIEAAPLAYMRGRTFENCWVILDEAQNTTPKQMKMFLTRIGENCRVIVNGDTTQKDIDGTSGLEDAIQRFRKMSGVETVQFSVEDVVRSGIVKEILKRYEH